MFMKYILLFVIIASFCSCKKQDIDTWEGDNGVAFLYTYEIAPKTYNFSTTANLPKVKDTVFLDMQISGRLTDYPRKIKIKSIAGTNAKVGEDYDLPEEITLPANAYGVKYPVLIYKSPKLLLDSMTLVVEIAESSEFKLGLTGSTPRKTTSGSAEYYSNRATVYIFDMLTRPSNWSDANYKLFSSVKLRFMLKTVPASNGRVDWFTPVRAAAQLPVLRAALASYEAANGPLLDESNIRVAF